MRDPFAWLAGIVVAGLISLALWLFFYHMPERQATCAAHKMQVFDNLRGATLCIDDSGRLFYFDNEGSDK